MPEGDPGLLDQAWTGWGNWWNPKEVAAGSSYDAEGLGLARQSAIGNLGGKILALAQAGLQPAQRAQLLTGIAPGDDFQKSLSEGATMRLHAATAAKLRGEMESEAASNAMLDRLLAGKTGAGGGVPAANPGAGGGIPTANPGAGGTVGDPIRQALAALMPAESGGNERAQNAQGYSGRYQIGSSLAADSGVYRPAPGEAVADDRGRATNTWRGQWVLPGFEPMSHEQWRANPAAQQAAAEAAMQHNWQQIQAAGLDKHIGENIGGVTVTAPGLLQGMWLGGLRGLKTWVAGGGNPADSNGTTVGKWAALKPPGGATMTDASGSTYPGDPSATPGGGQPFQPLTKPRSLADLTPDQLTLVRAMPAKERAAKILELTSKADSPTLLSPAQSAHLGPGRWQWSPTTGYSRIAEGQTTDIPRSENQRYGYGPGAVLQRDASGNVKLLRDEPFRSRTPEELKAKGYNSNAIVQVGPDGKDVVIDKGTSATDPLNEAEAQGVIIQYGPAARAGTLDPNSPEGLRYRQATEMLQGPKNAKNVDLANTIHGQMIQGETWRNYNQAAPVMRDIREQAQFGTGAGDLAMIIGYAKLLDPNSVVKEGESENVRRTGGVFDTVQGMIQQVQGQGKLSPEVREHLIASAEARFAAYEEPWRAHVNVYRGRAQKAGTDPDMIWPDPGRRESRHEVGAPIPPDETQQSLVRGAKERVRSGDWTRLKAAVFLRQYRIPETVLDR